MVKTDILAFILLIASCIVRFFFKKTEFNYNIYTMLLFFALGLLVSKYFQ